MAGMVDMEGIIPTIPLTTMQIIINLILEDIIAHIPQLAALAILITMAPALCLQNIQMLIKS